MIDSELTERRSGYRDRINVIQNVREEAKLLRNIHDGETYQQIENMDKALQQFEKDIQSAHDKYTKAVEQVQKNGGRVNQWTIGRNFIPRFFFPDYSKR